jgi:N6-L-threonylcarbamoyladenine synthase
MNDKRIILGIDTSNYTTSVALMYDDGELIANIKRPLPVAEGERGLRQSEAVFAHIKNIPSAMEEAKTFLDGRNPVAVGVSAKPRNLEGSYMPCFLSGVAVAEAIATSLGAPIYRFSHQCGHVMAALYSSGSEELMGGRFAAFHVSGGTTELLLVKGGDHGFDTELVGGTKDLNAGQVIDRIGVFLGMPFPAGPHLERAALAYSGKIPTKKVSVDGTYVNLSGLENMARKIYEESGDRGKTAAFVFEYLGNAIALMCDNLVSAYGNMPFVFAGGVMCNSIIKGKLNDRFDARFAEPLMSADNAVGIAELTRLNFIK